MKVRPTGGQLDSGLWLSPQGLRGHKALKIKRVFPREHVIHGATQLMRKYRERFGFAVFVFEFGKVRFPRLTLADEEHGGFGKKPSEDGRCRSFCRKSPGVSRPILWRISPSDNRRRNLAHGESTGCRESHIRGPRPESAQSLAPTATARTSGHRALWHCG